MYPENSLVSPHPPVPRLLPLPPACSDWNPQNDLQVRPEAEGVAGLAAAQGVGDTGQVLASELGPGPVVRQGGTCLCVLGVKT